MGPNDASHTSWLQYLKIEIEPRNKLAIGPTRYIFCLGPLRCCSRSQNFSFKSLYTTVLNLLNGKNVIEITRRQGIGNRIPCYLTSSFFDKVCFNLNFSRQTPAVEVKQGYSTVSLFCSKVVSVVDLYPGPIRF
jgi:hypothetical protein